ncbi:hypothetical protein Hanom_Chr10g00917091 [Helianthus anomalus]
MAPHKWHRFKSSQAECEARMEILKARNEESTREVCYDTLDTVGQSERYDRLVTGPLRIFLESPFQLVHEFNLEFLSTFTLKKDITKFRR